MKHLFGYDVLEPINTNGHIVEGTNQNFLIDKADWSDRSNPDFLYEGACDLNNLFTLEVSGTEYPVRFVFKKVEPSVESDWHEWELEGFLAFVDNVPTHYAYDAVDGTTIKLYRYYIMGDTSK